MMRCPRCAGNKIIQSMGFMESQCPVCKGIGQLPASAQPTLEASNAIAEDVAVESKSVQKRKAIQKAGSK